MRSLLLASLLICVFSLGFMFGNTYEKRVAIKAMRHVTDTATQVIDDLKKRCP